MHIEQITSDLVNDQRSFWRWLKRMRPGQKSNIPDIHHQGKTLTSPIQKAKAFCKFFTSIFVHENEATLEVLKEELTKSRSHDELVEINMTREEVYNLLCKIDPSKSCGPDEVPGRLLKEGAEWLAEPLSKLFLLTLSKGVLPHDWTSANVSPVHKKGSKHSVSNYRPVSLTCIAVKLLERIVYNNLYDYLTISGKLNRFHHGNSSSVGQIH